MVYAILGTCLAVTAFSASRAIHYRNVNKKYEEMRDSLYINFPEDTVVEYGDTFDPLADVEHSEGELYTSGTIDTHKLGISSITYTVTGKEMTYGMTAAKSVERMVRVVDMQSPVIELNGDHVDITAGDDYDPASNVASVNDVVDGDLPYSEELQNGYYTVTVDGDLAEAGDHVVTVSAQDFNGNKAEKVFTVTVADAAEPEPEPEPTYVQESDPTAAAAAEPVSYTYDGQILSPSAGTVQGPSGKETYYNLDMSGVVANARAAGIGGDYWVRSDGAKMMGDYIICACDVTGAVRNRYDIVETSLGSGICLDTGGFAAGNPSQIDIATSW